MKKVINVIICAVPFAINAQNTFNAAGFTIATPTVVHTYSIGEMAIISTAINNDLIVTHGVLQPTENTSATITNAIIDVLQNVQVYPNPSSAVVNTAFTITHAGDVCISIMDVTGKQIYKQARAYSPGIYIIPITIETLPEGTYTLNLINETNNKKQQYSCKIFKR